MPLTLGLPIYGLMNYAGPYYLEYDHRVPQHCVYELKKKTIERLDISNSYLFIYLETSIRYVTITEVKERHKILLLKIFCTNICFSDNSDNNQFSFYSGRDQTSQYIFANGNNERKLCLISNSSKN